MTAQEFKRARTRIGFSQEEFAELTGLTTERVIVLELGYGTFRPRDIAAIETITPTRIRHVLNDITIREYDRRLALAGVGRKPATKGTR